MIYKDAELLHWLFKDVLSMELLNPIQAFLFLTHEGVGHTAYHFSNCDSTAQVGPRPPHSPGL